MTPEQAAEMSYPKPHGEYDLLVPEEHYNALVKALFSIHRAYFEGELEKVGGALDRCKREIGICADRRLKRMFPEGVDFS